jgi:hypothetical protein
MLVLYLHVSLHTLFVFKFLCSSSLLEQVLKVCDDGTIIRDAIGKLPDCYCCNCHGERRGRGEAKATLPQAYYTSLPRDNALWIDIVFTRVLFRLRGKIEQRVCIKFCVNLSISATKALETVREAVGEHSLSLTTVSELHSRLKTDRESVEDDGPSEWPSTSQTTENVEKFETHPRRPSSNNPWVRRRHWAQLWSLPGDRNRKLEQAPHCREVCSLTLHKWSKTAARKRVSWAAREG